MQIKLTKKITLSFIKLEKRIHKVKNFVLVVKFDLIFIGNRVK
jgi:hypothetical protein